MFGDPLQAQLDVGSVADIAVSVLASVIGRRPERDAVLIDAGSLTLSRTARPALRRVTTTSVSSATNAADRHSARQA